MTSLLHHTHDVDGITEFLRFFIGPVRRSQRFENIGNDHHLGGNRHLVAGQFTRIPGPMQGFVVAPRNLRNIAQVAWIRKFLEHFDGLDDVIVYFESLLMTQGAPPDLKVVDLSPVVEMLRLIKLEPPLVFRLNGIGVAPGDKVLVPV